MPYGDDGIIAPREGRKGVAVLQVEQCGNCTFHVEEAVFCVFALLLFPPQPLPFLRYL